MLERASPFDRLSPEERRRILGDVLIEYFEPDEVILEQGRTAHEFLYVVESGVVRLLEAGTRRLVAEYGEGGVFGSHGLVRGGALPYEARAVEPTVCVLLWAERFRELYATNEHFAAFFESEISRYGRTSRVPFDASSARLSSSARASGTSSTTSPRPAAPPPRPGRRPGSCEGGGRTPSSWCETARRSWASSRT